MRAQPTPCYCSNYFDAGMSTLVCCTSRAASCLGQRQRNCPHGLSSADHRNPLVPDYPGGNPHPEPYPKPYPLPQVDREQVSGAVNLVFAGMPLTNAYRNLTNVVLRVAMRAGGGGGGPAVLVNAHFDSVFGTHGAAARRAGRIERLLSAEQVIGLMGNFHM